jgi:hypothetical protein
MPWRKGKEKRLRRLRLSETSVREREIAAGPGGRGQSGAAGTSSDWLVDGCGRTVNKRQEQAGRMQYNTYLRKK